VRRLKLIIVFLPFTLTFNVITADILLVLRNRGRKVIAFSMLPTTFGAQFIFHLSFCQNLPIPQLGLSAIADLHVYICDATLCKRFITSRAVTRCSWSQVAI